MASLQKESDVKKSRLKSMEAVVVEMKPKEYIKRVEKENPVEKPWEPDDDFKHKPLLKKSHLV